MRFCTAKNTGSGSMSKRSQHSQKEWGQEATATLIPQKAPSVKIVTCAKLSCTLIHMVTGHLSYLQETEPVPQMSSVISKLRQQQGSISINPCLESRSTTTKPTNMTRQNASSSSQDLMYCAGPHHVTALFWRRNSPRCNCQNFSMSLPSWIAGFRVAASHRSCILRESLLLAGWHCHQLSLYLLHCHPALQEAPGHTASMQLSTLSQYSWVPPHCP